MSKACAVVIGGTRGMGFATAKLLLTKGYKVIISGSSAESAAKAVAELGGQAEGHELKYGDHASIEAFFQKVETIDALVLAGSSAIAWGPFAKITMDQFRKALEGKLVAYAEATQAALPKMSKTGSITFVSGGASRQAIPGTAYLAAVNGGIVQMAQTLAKELAPIRVNVISPGLVDTHAYDHMSSEQKQGFFKEMGGKLPVGRIGQPEEIAEAICFCIQSGFTTGAIIDVDGGSRYQ